MNFTATQGTNMKYDPATKHRRRLRLPGYNYSDAGHYFITVCCEGRICRFGNIHSGNMMLNDCGKIAHEEWVGLPIRFPYLRLDVFQVMPNHLHGILILTNPVIPTVASPSLGSVMSAYKSIVMNKCLAIFKSRNERLGKLWQRNYYETIIDGGKEYIQIANYIIDNPVSWEQDELFRGG